MKTNYANGKRTKKRVLDFIIDYKTQHDGLAPTYREIAAATDLHSPSVVAYHLGGLQRDGLIRVIEKSKNRRIIVVGGRWVAPVLEAAG